VDNIEEFNIVVGEVFGQCYREFPCRVNISTSELGDTLKKAKDEFDVGELDLRDPEYNVASESVQWLIEAGYIWCKTPRRDSFLQTTLSPKGLEVLNATPDGLELKVSFGEQLSKGVLSLGKDATKQIVLSTLSLGTKLIVGI
jgi:hypothetical protein